MPTCKPSSSPSSSHSFSFLSVSLYSFIFLLNIRGWSASHSTTWASSLSERITLVLFIHFLDTSGWVGGIGVSPMLLSWVSVGSAPYATSTWLSGSFVVCMSTSMVVWADYVDRSETVGLGLISLFCVFLPFFTLGMMKSNFNINVFKKYGENCPELWRRFDWLTNYQHSHDLLCNAVASCLPCDMCTGTELPPSWDRGMHVTFEYPLHSSPSRGCYHPAHSAYNSSCFIYIYVVLVLWMRSFI